MYFFWFKEKKLNKETFLHHNLHFTHIKLSKAEKEVIKNKIRKEEKSRLIKIIITTIILAIIISILCYNYLLFPLFEAFKY